MNFHTEETEEGVVIFLEGNLTIQYATAFKKAIRLVFDRPASYLLDLSDVSAIDLSCLQLLYAAWKSSLDSETNLSIRGHVSEEVKECIKHAGFESHDWLLNIQSD